MRHVRGYGLALLALAGLVAPAAGAGAEKVAQVEGISEYKLDNGLKVLLFPDPSRPTVTVNITYLVGSRHEGLGEKGMAHLLEHMLFKGTSERPNVWGLLQDHGANFNGTTWLDRTNYYETLPASDENLEFALQLEADRMVHSKVAREDLDTEMTVVRNEFEMGEDSPRRVLNERLMSAAYLWHTYGDSTIGNRSDIERVPIDNLRRFYAMFYRPDNAVLVVAGKFEPEKALALINRVFAPIPKPEQPVRAPYTTEPAQDGERFVTVRRVGKVAAIGALYHVPAGRHPDFAAIEVLEQILTRQPSGRLYKALVEAGLAANLQGEAYALADPGVLILSAEVRPPKDPDLALKVLTETVEGLADAKITDEEVERARNALLKEIDLALRSSAGLGVALSEYVAQGDWRLIFAERERLRDVTPKEVAEVARKYLVATNRTSGIFRPTDEARRTSIPEAPSAAEIVKNIKAQEELSAGEAFAATPEAIEGRTERTKLGRGIQLALLPKQTRGKDVRVEFRLRCGNAEALAGRVQAFNLLPALMMRGTARHTYAELRDELDRLKTKMSLAAPRPGLVAGSIETDREHLADALRLLAEVLREPALPADQFDVIVREQLARLESQLTNPLPRGMRALSRAIRPWPEGDVRYQPTIEQEIDRVKAVRLDGLKELHAQVLGADHLDVAAVGDFEPQEVKDLLDKALGSWASRTPYEPILQPYRPAKATDETIAIPDRENAVVGLATTFPLKESDPDYPALDFANFVFGASPKSRLMTRLRHKGGLSYGAGTMLAVDERDEQSALLGFAICNPANAAKAQEAMAEEYRRWVEEGPTSGEVEEFRQGYKQQIQANLADDGFVARTLADGLETGTTFGLQAKLLEAADALTADRAGAAVRKHLGKAPVARVKAGAVGGAAPDAGGGK